MDAIQALDEFVQRVDAAVVVKRKEAGHWSIGLHWAEEAPDSPMYGMAAYGTGETLREAVAEALTEARAWPAELAPA